MPVLQNRDYRPVVEFRALDEPGGYIVEGYATTFNAPYSMGNFGGVEFFEEVDVRAFDAADMSDVIMQYDHAGRVLARNKNGTLQLMPDEHGLKVRADLSKSDAARSLYEDIKNGLVDKMSFGFTVEQPGGDEFNKDTNTRRILRVQKLYDVSAVSVPANDGTAISISTRSFFDGVVEDMAAECRKREEIERKRRALCLLLEL